MNFNNRSTRGNIRSALLPFFVWLLINLVAMGSLVIYQRAALLSELQAASFTLHREASQRAGQHDAHLTALSTIAQSKARTADVSQNDVFLEVAATITRFYPRIDEIQLVPMDPALPVAGTRALEPELADTIRAAVRSYRGLPELLAPSARPGHYMMVKRSPNTDNPHDGLTLSIDAGSLIGSDDAFWSGKGVARRILMPDGTVLFSHPASFDDVDFSKKLGSASQPLLFQTALAVSWGDLLPFDQLIPLLILTNLLFFGGLIIVRQTQRTRHAERRAELSGFEARLAHASRVNTMGEMASGMAHELTQPLTALLAGAQAGRRLLSRNNTAALAGALDDMVEQARRASAILDRLRNWSRPQRRQTTHADLRLSLQNVQTLLASEAARRDVKVELGMPETPVMAAVDPVEMEQVMFNLLRNAIESFHEDDQDRRVNASLKAEGAVAVLEIADNGPGVAPDLLPRLFTPFTTTRPEGTGLGLALSQRLVERFGGEISYIPRERGALFRVVLPIAEETGS
ncbi:sensor histidine kinase [Brucella intermedia]|uniref:sensor histidine kinase n=1 Tax=Brucella intermedia TaxID=94625 RepID=UPI00124CEE96|nr:ATP-binding protein [Brucella intermedia]KAB2730018.1 two-component sensor histidine kinase [Brucella intermedia]